MSRTLEGLVAAIVVSLVAGGFAWGETVTFDDLPAGFHAGTVAPNTEFELFGDLGTGPIMVFGLNPRFGAGVNAAVVFDSAAPTGEDEDLGSPNETCDPPGPGEGLGGEVGMPFENCPDEPINKVLIMGEDLGR